MKFCFDFSNKNSYTTIIKSGQHIVVSLEMVGVAQVVERQIVVLNVAGSSPVVHPTSLKYLLSTDLKNYVGAWRSW